MLLLLLLLPFECMRYSRLVLLLLLVDKGTERRRHLSLDTLVLCEAQTRLRDGRSRGVLHQACGTLPQLRLNLHAIVR
jgi:hypothetical protein